MQVTHSKICVSEVFNPFVNIYIYYIYIIYIYIYIIYIYILQAGCKLHNTQASFCECRHYSFYGGCTEVWTGLLWKCFLQGSCKMIQHWVLLVNLSDNHSLMPVMKCLSDL